MTDENVVTDDVAAGPPDEMVVVAAKEVARALDFRPVFHLEGGMMHFLMRAMRGEVHGVMVGATAQENKKVGAPIRHAEPEHVAIKRRDLLDVGNVEGKVPQLDQRESARGGVDGRERR